MSDPQTEEWLATPQRFPQANTVEDFHHNLNVVQTCIADSCRGVARSKWSTIADLPDLHWSVIGHLQTKKVKLVAHFPMEFQALNSLRVAEALGRHLQAEGRSLDVFVQVNTLGGPASTAFLRTTLQAFVHKLPTFSALRIRGLMTLALLTRDTMRVRACSSSCVRCDPMRRDIPAGIEMNELPMGMSGDFEIAIEEWCHGRSCRPGYL